MNRRDAIARVGLLLGGTVVGADVFLSGCKKRTDLAAVGLDFSTETIGFLDEVGETILPASPGSPGAKETQIGEFMKRIVTDCYPEEYQQIFAAGIGKLKELSQKKYNEDFMNLTANQKHDLLVDVDKENKNHSSRKKYKRDFMDLTTSQKQDVLTEADWEMKSTLPAKKRSTYMSSFAFAASRNSSRSCPRSVTLSAAIRTISPTAQRSSKLPTHTT